MDSSCDIIPTTFIGEKKPSTTMPALVAAAGLQAAARDPRTSHFVAHAGPDVAELNQLLVRHALSKYSTSLGQLAFKGGNFFPAPQNVVLKSNVPFGYLQHCAMRTLLLQQMVEEMIFALQAKGKRVQVVILGAGLCTLALCLRKQFGENGVTIMEVDHGEQRDIKIEALLRLRSMGAHPLRYYGHYVNGTSNLHFVNCNIAKENWHALFSSQKMFDKNVDSIIIAERLMYSSQEEVTSLLRTLNEMMTEDSKFIFSLSECAQTTTEFYGSLHSGANESHKFALPASDIPHFVGQHFYVEGKVFSSDFIAQANESAPQGNSAAKLPLENYFVLGIRGLRHQKKLEDENDIYAIPTLRVRVPKPAPKKKLEDEQQPRTSFMGRRF
jgi:O-methyltransferase involved in polyketide biosynthesis